MTHEERLLQLEEKLSSVLGELNCKISRIQSYTDTFNATTRYSYRHAGNKHIWSMSSYALKNPTVSAEMGPIGLHVGPEKVYELYAVGHSGDNEDEARSEEFTGGHGLFMAEHPLTNPVIEVSGDNKTAKGLFFSPGCEGTGTDEKGHRGFWIWMRPACEFCIEDDEWKVWHNHGFSSFVSSWDKEWTDGDVDMMGAFAPAPIPGEEMKPPPPPPTEGLPTTFHQEYRSWIALEPWPQPPEPYYTYEGTQPVVGAPCPGAES